MASACALAWSGAAAGGAGASGVPLELAGVAAARRPHPAELEVDARLAAARRALARSAGALLDGAVLSVAAGPRRLEGGERESDLAVGVELPLAFARPEQRELAAALDAAEPWLKGAAEVEARRELTGAFVELWRAQERFELRREELATVDRWLEATRRRVEAGADASYEAALVAGERERAALELERAREAAAMARAGLTAQAVLPEGELRPAPPPESSARVDCAGEGILAGAARTGAALAAAEAGLDRRADGARWALAGDLAREGDEEVARVGLAYRIAPRGEGAALDETRAAAAAAARRAAELAVAALDGRRAAARARLAAPPPPDASGEVAAALAALDARLAEGKSRPSEALPLRRQLLAAREAALDARAERALAAAELAALCAELPAGGGS